MDKIILEFLNIYFYIFIIIISFNWLIFCFNNEQHDLQIDSFNKNPKIFNIIMWTLFILSIKLT
jgi:hypothetical protein